MSSVNTFLYKSSTLSWFLNILHVDPGALLGSAPNNRTCSHSRVVASLLRAPYTARPGSLTAPEGGRSDTY